MAKANNSGAAPANKEGATPTNPPAAPTPTEPVTPPVTDKNVADPNVNDSDITDTTQQPASEVNTQSTEPTTPPATDPETPTEEPEKVEVKESMKRKELDAVAVEEGLANASKYKDKSVVVAAVERVRAGEDASVVDEELTPVVDNGGGDVEVEVVNPYYDLEVKTHRKPGDKYKTTDSRAAMLRGKKLIK
jgi:hypothetical protein